MKADGRFKLHQVI